MSQKVLELSPDEAKYIDPSQMASIQMTDGTIFTVKDAVQPQAEAQEEFVEETKNEQQYQTQEVQGQQGQKLRGRGVLGALAAGAVLGTAAALGAGIRRPYYGYGYGYPYRYGYGYGRPFMRPMFRPFIF